MLVVAGGPVQEFHKVSVKNRFAIEDVECALDLVAWHAGMASRRQYDPDQLTAAEWDQHPHAGSGPDIGLPRRRPVIEAAIQR